MVYLERAVVLLRRVGEVQWHCGGGQQLQLDIFSFLAVGQIRNLAAPHRKIFSEFVFFRHGPVYLKQHLSATAIEGNATPLAR